MTTALHDNDFLTAPSPSPLWYGVSDYVALTHITANGEHFLRSGGPNTDYGVDSNHAPGKMNLLAIFRGDYLNIPRLRDCLLTLRVRCNEFYLPNPARLAVLVQSNDKRSENGKGSAKNINSVQINDLICEQLGAPRVVNRAAETSGDRVLNVANWVDVHVPMSSNPADWLYMPPASGHEGSYIADACPTAPLDGGLINLMIVALFDNALPTYELGSVEDYAPADQGTFDIDRITISA